MIESEPFALSHSLNSTYSTDRSSDEIDPGLMSFASRNSVNDLLIAFNVTINKPLSFLGRSFAGNCILKARPINIDCRALLIVSIPETLGNFCEHFRVWHLLLKTCRIHFYDADMSRNNATDGKCIGIGRIS